MLAETAAPAAPSPTPSTAARASCRPQTRVRAFRAQSADYKYRARAGGRRRPSGKLASVPRLASDAGFYLFDGIDHPLRIKITSSSTTAYYELDLAGNVRGLRASGGASLGGYRYSAFGVTLEDTTSITQPLRWKARWWSPVAGGTYDVRARQWSPELGVFLSVDEFDWFSETTTLWGWPGMSPSRYSDPRGRGSPGVGPPGPIPPPGGGGQTCGGRESKRKDHCDWIYNRCHGFCNKKSTGIGTPAKCEDCCNRSYSMCMAGSNIVPECWNE